MDVEYRLIHGYRRAFRRLGTGPPLLLIHGIGVSSATWLPVLPALAEHFDVIAPDLLGHGHSDKPRADYGVGAYACGMRDLLSVLDVEQPTVVGHSLGGGVAMQFAYQFPERCARLLLVSSGGVGPQVHPVLRLLASPYGDRVLRLLTRPASLRLAGMLGPLLRVAGERDAERLLAALTSLSTLDARQAYLRTLRSVVDGRGQVVTMLDRCYLAAGLPTWVLWGGRDAVIPLTHGARACAAMPGSRLVFFPEAGHFPHEDEPERFVSLVRSFVAETSPAEYDAERWRRLLREGGETEASSGT
ncbi:MAG TPA: alpha/beta fold hydrolase [Mycobacteriales bacterium]|nr:alpha/beta fold hydrolase [Mycobacteriales bacterium]